MAVSNVTQSNQAPKANYASQTDKAAEDRKAQRQRDEALRAEREQQTSKNAEQSGQVNLTA